MSDTLHRFMKPTTSQTVAYTGTAGTLANPLNTYTRVIRVVLTTAGFFAVGHTATTADTYMPAGVPDYFAVSGGETPSAIQSAAGGTLYVTEMSM